MATQRFVALLRGINVGGHHKVKMAELREFLARLGHEDVKTYIQSGNVVFRAEGTAAALEVSIADAFAEEWGFRPRFMVLRWRDFLQAYKGNPFPQAEDEPKKVHVYFLADKPSRGADGRLREQPRTTEEWALKGRRLYVYTPDGLGRSTFAPKIEKALGVAGTARNWNTVRALHELGSA